MTKKIGITWKLLPEVRRKELREAIERRDGAEVFTLAKRYLHEDEGLNPHQAHHVVIDVQLKPYWVTWVTAHEEGIYGHVETVVEAFANGTAVVEDNPHRLSSVSRVGRGWDSRQIENDMMQTVELVAGGM